MPSPAFNQLFDRNYKPVSSTRSLIQTAEDGRTREIEFRGCDDGKIGMLVTIYDQHGHIELSKGTAYLFSYDEFKQFRALANAAVLA